MNLISNLGSSTKRTVIVLCCPVLNENLMGALIALGMKKDSSSRFVMRGVFALRMVTMSSVLEISLVFVPIGS